MSENPPINSHTEDCWKRIGIAGDRTCPELEKYVHCRNCPKYSEQVIKMLDREPPEGYLEGWTSLLAAEKEVETRGTVPVTIFRLGDEWLALSTRVLEEMTEVRPVHAIPHRTNNVLLGVVNVRGTLQLCISLANLLGIEGAEAADRQQARLARKQLVVLNRHGNRWAFVADEIHGIYRVSSDDFGNVPVTVAKAVPKYTKNVFRWQDRNVGYLDDELVFHSLKRSVL